MTSWGDEDLRCFARVQCYPNSSAMLIRSIIKQKNPRLEESVPDARAAPNPSMDPSVPNWNDQRQSHTPPQHFYKHQRSLLPKIYILWTVSLPLGWTGAPGSWSLVSSNAISVWNSGMGQIGVAWAVRCIYLGLKTTGTIPLCSSHSWAPFCTFLLAKKKGKEVPKSKNHSKATVTKTGSAGQRGRELAFCRMWQYLG